MDKIDRVGTFRGEILETAMVSTKNGFPMWKLRVKATEFYAETDLEAFGLTEPGWVDWSAYAQAMYGQLVLFNDSGPLFNYEDVQKAVGWDGSSFSTLADGYVGKRIMFRVQDNDPAYADKNPFQMDGIDHVDASPTRELVGLDATKLKALDQKFAQFMQPAKVAPAKAPARPTPAAPAPTTASTSPTTSAPSTPPAKPSGPPKAPPPKAPEPETAPFETSLDSITDMNSAWELLGNNRGGVSENVIAETWLSVLDTLVTELGKDEGDLTGDEWKIVATRVAAETKITL